jgi:hypothetical protein
MPPMVFEPKISAGERPQTYTLDRAATGTGDVCIHFNNTCKYKIKDFSLVSGSLLIFINEPHKYFIIC